jgi:hypothetical protein
LSLFEVVLDVLERFQIVRNLSYSSTVSGHGAWVGSAVVGGEQNHTRGIRGSRRKPLQPLRARNRETLAEFMRFEQF